MKKLRPLKVGSKKAKINMVKVGGEKYELSPVAEEVGEEEWEDEEDDE